MLDSVRPSNDSPAVMTPPDSPNPSCDVGKQLTVRKQPIEVPELVLGCGGSAISSGAPASQMRVLRQLFDDGLVSPGVCRNGLDRLRRALVCGA